MIYISLIIAFVVTCVVTGLAYHLGWRAHARAKLDHDNDLLTECDVNLHDNGSLGSYDVDKAIHQDDGMHRKDYDLRRKWQMDWERRRTE